MMTRMMLGCLIVSAAVGGADAAILCEKKSGVIVVRTACRRKETPLDPSTFSVPGPKGDKGDAGAPGASVFAGAIPSGTTVTGVWAVPAADGNAAVSFPVPAPAALGDADVNFAPDASGVTTDDDAGCTGTLSQPTAPAGKVCLYVQAIGSGASSLGGYAIDRFGFFVYGIQNSPSNAAARGTWAYTAP